MLESLYELSREFLAEKAEQYQRYFYKQTQLSEQFSIFTGQRGVGKTTLMIQYLLDYVQQDRLSPKILYVQTDHFALGNQSLYEIAKDFCAMGGEFIAFDEIHKYRDWSKELKSITDTFRQLKIIASGSSALEIHKGTHDLSRRALFYKIPGLSFREFLELYLNLEFGCITLQELLIQHVQFADQVKQELKSVGKHVLPFFQKYCHYGYYPYFREFNDEIKFKITLEQNLHTTLDSDLTSVYPNINQYSLGKIKKLLSYIATAVPFSPNWRNLKTVLEIGDERTLKNYFKYLEDAELIKLVYKSSNKLSATTHAEKVYLQNPNLMQAIVEKKTNQETLREIFFINMLSKCHEISVPLQGDFLVDQQWLFEVGGKNKSREQIYDQKNAYLACDNIEIGINQKIPLWLFGFLY